MPFTEHGVTMLASILKSDKAVKMNIEIVRAFIALRQYALHYRDLADEIQEIRQTVESHSEQLVKIYGAIETLLRAKGARNPSPTASESASNKKNRVPARFFLNMLGGLALSRHHWMPLKLLASVKIIPVGCEFSAHECVS